MSVLGKPQPDSISWLSISSKDCNQSWIHSKIDSLQVTYDPHLLCTSRICMLPRNENELLVFLPFKLLLNWSYFKIYNFQREWLVKNTSDWTPRTADLFMPAQNCSVGTGLGLRGDAEWAFRDGSMDGQMDVRMDRASQIYPLPVSIFATFGRCGSRTRRSFIRQFMSPSGLILSLGPAHSFIVPISSTTICTVYVCTLRARCDMDRNRPYLHLQMERKGWLVSWDEIAAGGHSSLTLPSNEERKVDLSRRNRIDGWTDWKKERKKEDRWRWRRRRSRRTTRILGKCAKLSKTWFHFHSGLAFAYFESLTLASAFLVPNWKKWWTNNVPL